MVKERPIIFNTDMVKAILGGRKMQTRRIIKPQPTPEPDRFEYNIFGNELWFPTSRSGKVCIYDKSYYQCPYGKIGDRLWVREMWYAEFYKAEDIDGPSYGYYEITNEDRMKELCTGIWYKSTFKIDIGNYIEKWTPSIFMPRWASRIDLEITDIRVERVQDIKPEDCEAEGIMGETKASPVRGLSYEIYKCQGLTYSTPRIAFENLWDSINAKRGYGWEVNPFVWCISFKKGVVNG